MKKPVTVSKVGGGAVEIKQLDIISVAKVSAFVGTLFGVVFNIINLFVITPFLNTVSSNLSTVLNAIARTQGIVTSLELSKAASIVEFVQVIVVFAALGFFSGALLAYVYNVYAKKYGGIKIRFS